ncbi:hypothetical protein MYX07_07070, partial [Patescibacteria group bacterium AH-259-L07]|nr:hypothetical protein [Patescibacteria group bacterium AH-259-L07]
TPLSLNQKPLPACRQAGRGLPRLLVKNSPLQILLKFGYKYYSLQISRFCEAGFLFFNITLTG